MEIAGAKQEEEEAGKNSSMNYERKERGHNEGEKSPTRPKQRVGLN